MPARLYENLEHWAPDLISCVAPYDIPIILPESLPNTAEWIPFNYLLSSRATLNVGIHTFVDDYQLQRLWNAPTKYIDSIKKVSCICSPDFSLYANTPTALNLFNHYRKHWLAAYWQNNGIVVIPTICWCDSDSFKWCFDGEPTKSVVAVSSVGTQRNADDKRAFLLGYDAMLERLEPSAIIFHGNIPKEARGNIVPIDTFTKSLQKRCNDRDSP